MTIERINDNAAAQIGLLPGRLYIAPEDAPRGEMLEDRYLAGCTVGQAHLAVSENIHEVRDMNGRHVCDIHFGGKMEITGKLASLTPSSLSLMLGAKRTKNGYELSPSAKRGRFTACMVLGVPDSADVLTFYAKLSTGIIEGATLGGNSAGYTFRIVDEISASGEHAFVSLAPISGGECA